MATKEEFYCLNVIKALFNVQQLISKVMAKLIEYQLQLTRKFCQIKSVESELIITFDSNNLLQFHFRLRYNYFNLNLKISLSFIVLQFL